MLDYCAFHYNRNSHFGTIDNAFIFTIQNYRQQKTWQSFANNIKGAVMFSQKISALLEKKLSQKSLSIPIIIGEKKLRNDIDDLLASFTPFCKSSSNLCVVDDANTSSALGDRVFAAIKSSNDNEHITFREKLEPSDENISLIRKCSQKCDAIIAVGSGTINDLCKYASFLDGKPYIIFPTAASMNGYLSANASIITKGNRVTQPAHLPLAVFADIDVINSAPIRLNRSGLGDSIARPTAQADWLLSHLLTNSNYDEAPFALLAEHEEEVFANAAGISACDYSTTQKLLEMLLLSGLGMTIAGGSYPASQGEHMIAHTYHMLCDNLAANQNIFSLHGEEIAITALYMANLQQNLLRTRPKLRNEVFNNKKMEDLFGTALTEELLDSFSKKQTRCASVEISTPLWETIRDRIEKIHLSPTRIEEILGAAGLSITTESIGWNSELFATACNFARFTRERFTFLDLQ